MKHEHQAPVTKATRNTTSNYTWSTFPYGVPVEGTDFQQRCVDGDNDKPPPNAYSHTGIGTRTDENPHSARTPVVNHEVFHRGLLYAGMFTPRW